MIQSRLMCISERIKRLFYDKERTKGSPTWTQRYRYELGLELAKLSNIYKFTTHSLFWEVMYLVCK